MFLTGHSSDLGQHSLEVRSATGMELKHVLTAASTFKPVFPPLMELNLPVAVPCRGSNLFSLYKMQDGQLEHRSATQRVTRHRYSVRQHSYVSTCPPHSAIVSVLALSFCCPYCCVCPFDRPCFVFVDSSRAKPIFVCRRFRRYYAGLHLLDLASFDFQLLLPLRRLSRCL